MAIISSSISIKAPVQKVFDVVADLAAYSTWLPESGAYKGTTSVSETPVRLGTTYIESNPSGIKHGKVIEFEEPTKITFSQPLELNPRWMGVVVDVKITVTLKESEGVTVMERKTVVGYPLALKPLSAVLNKAFVSEGGRTMEELKKHCEALA